MARSTTTNCIQNTYGPGGRGDFWKKYQLYCFWSWGVGSCPNFHFCPLVLAVMLKFWFMLTGPGGLLLKFSFLLTGPGGVMSKFWVILTGPGGVLLKFLFLFTGPVGVMPKFPFMLSGPVGVVLKFWLMLTGLAGICAIIFETVSLCSQWLDLYFDGSYMWIW